MRKLTVLVSIFFVVSSLLFAGGAQEDTEKSLTLTIAGRDGAYGDAMQLAADAYQEKHPEVSFEILKLSGSSLFEKSVIDMRSGSGTYDVILIDDPNITQFQEVGWLADMDALYAKQDLTIDPDFIKPALKLGRYPYM